MAGRIKGVEYTTKDGDFVDEVCWTYYGYGYGSLEAVMQINRHLSKLPEDLPAGIVIFLPDIPNGNKQRTDDIWK